jgi:hypothetical protein
MNSAVPSRTFEADYIRYAIGKHKELDVFLANDDEDFLIYATYAEGAYALIEVFYDDALRAGDSK